MSKGKGNKIINIPSARAKAREELVKLIEIIKPEQAVTLHAGKRKLTLKASDVEHYRGERGRRGNKLPRGLQRVDRIELESIAAPEVEAPVTEVTKLWMGPGTWTSGSKCRNTLRHLQWAPWGAW